VSGLSDGVLITEAADKSGTLHTANFALEQGRTVMAVPGNITSGLSSGTNNLIKTGATPITCGEDILIALGLEPKTIASEQLAANAEEAAILDALMRGISDGSELLEVSGLAPQIFNQTLTMLEITGKIRPLGAGHWALYN
jgi:DNA processing protein